MEHRKDVLIARNVVSARRFTTYLRAFRKTKGHLPSVVLHEDILREKVGNSDIKMTWTPCAYGPWVKELLVIPGDGKFSRTEDIVDFQTGWILPISELSPEIRDKMTSVERPGLWVDPAGFRKERGKVVVHPKKVVLLDPMITDPGRYRWGVIDHATGIPLARYDEYSFWPDVPGDKLGWVLLAGGKSIRPIAYELFHGAPLLRANDLPGRPALLVYASYYEHSDYDLFEVVPL